MKGNALVHLAAPRLSAVSTLDQHRHQVYRRILRACDRMCKILSLDRGRVGYYGRGIWDRLLSLSQTIDSENRRKRGYGQRVRGRVHRIGLDVYLSAWL